MFRSFQSKRALLFVDVQNFCANRKGTEYGKLPAPEFEERVGFYFREMEEKVVPNMQAAAKGLPAPRASQVMYTTIESLTKDGPRP
jgi:ureidoacrylate peracid hydrolase